MTNVVPGLVTFRNPIAMHANAGGGSKTGNAQTGLQLVTAVQGVWVTNATGSDGLMKVTDILPVNQDVLQHLINPVNLTLTLTSVTAIQ